MNYTIKTMINSIMLTENFKVSQLVDSTESVKWIPLIICGEHGATLGVSVEAEWVIEEKSGLRVLDEPWKFFRVIVLLERSKTDIYNALTQAFKSYNLIVNVNEVFPFVEVTRIGLEQKSDYWAELALNWFVELPIKEKEKLLSSLSNIINARWTSQKLRHRAKKELNMLKNN